MDFSEIIGIIFIFFILLPFTIFGIVSGTHDVLKKNKELKEQRKRVR